MVGSCVDRRHDCAAPFSYYLSLSLSSETALAYSSLLSSTQAFFFVSFPTFISWNSGVEIRGSFLCKSLTTIEIDSLFSINLHRRKRRTGSWGVFFLFAYSRDTNTPLNSLDSLQSLKMSEFLVREDDRTTAATLRRRRNIQKRKERRQAAPPPAESSESSDSEGEVESGPESESEEESTLEGISTQTQTQPPPSLTSSAATESQTQSLPSLTSSAAAEITQISSQTSSSTSSSTSTIPIFTPSPGPSTGAAPVVLPITEAPVRDSQWTEKPNTNIA